MGKRVERGIPAEYSPGSIAEAAATEALTAQQAHLQAIDGLSTIPGFDQEQFVEMYGREVLNGTDPSQRSVVERWAKLGFALGSQANFLALISTQRSLEPGCYGLGHRPSYVPESRLAVFDAKQPLSLEFEREKGRLEAIRLRGAGVIYTANLSRDDEKEFGNNVGFLLGHRLLPAAEAPMDTYSADTLGEIATEMDSRHPYSGYRSFDDHAAMWLLFRHREIARQIGAIDPES